jgi:perosamine synthetase
MTTGDGGMITTLKKDTAQLIRKFGCLGYKTLEADEGRVRNNKDIFQNPEYSRHDDIGLNYRMSEFQAAVGLAQLEKLESLVELRQDIAQFYIETIDNCDFLIRQKVDDKSLHAYWTFAVRFIHKEVTWERFRVKFIEYGGSGIYAAWKLLYQEDVFTNGNWMKMNKSLYKNYKLTRCPNAELIQPQLMQFPLNDRSIDEAMTNIDALNKTINYFS